MPDWLLAIETMTGIERGDWASVILSVAVIIQGLAIIRMKPERRDLGEYRECQRTNTSASADAPETRKR